MDAVRCHLTRGCQVVIRRGRLCVPVRANRQSEIPKGSMRLAQSTSGATLYVEPAPIVPLNNSEARLSDAVAAEEARVLQRLSRTVAKHAAVVSQVSHEQHDTCLQLCQISNARALDIWQLHLRQPWARACGMHASDG